VAESDQFTAKLLSIYMNVNAINNGYSNRITVSINRSDYMLHEQPNDARDILQVEINTISASFGSLSNKVRIKIWIIFTINTNNFYLFLKSYL